MEKIWLKNYEEGVPAEINPDTYSSLVEAFEESFTQFSSRPAYVNMGEYLTYREIDELSLAFAAFLQSLGLKKGDRFAIMMPNLLQYPVSMIAALRCGLMVVNINPLYTARELENQLKDSGATAIIVLANFAHTVQQVYAKTDLKHIILTEIGDLFSWPKSTVVNLVVKYIKKMVPACHIPNVITFKKGLKLGKKLSKLSFQKPDIKGEDVAFLQYTGGTTATLAKGTMLTHRNMVANLEQAYHWIKSVESTTNEMIITALPLYHIFSLTANCLTFMKRGALNVLITNPRDMSSFLKDLKKYHFAAFTGVNTLFNALLHQEEFAKLDFSRLRLSLGGGMAVQKAVAERWKAVTGCPLLEAYGLTETSPAACINPIHLKEYNGSIGLPVSSTEISIRDENEQELPINTPGELCIRGPQVMKGYWNKPEETKIALKNGWLHTGDIATIDEEGFVRIVDRKKDLIVVSGFNVYPNEVEDVIALMPEVKEVAVVGIPTNEATGEMVKAFIVKKDQTLTSKAIVEHCRKLLTGYKIPKEVEFRNELPKSAVGKILRRSLRERSK